MILHATCASGLDGVLAAELEALGLSGVRRRGAGAAFEGGLEAGYAACLRSRVANRVLLPLHAGRAADPDALYALAREVDWSEHLAPDGSLAVDFLSASSGITHTRYGALRTKDAIVDQFREAGGVRPDVDRETPDVRVNVYVHRDRARIALDLSGASLHRRGYRTAGGPAPLKENVAAALLLAAGWGDRSDAAEPFVDPACGSGTLVVEAAAIAARRAPGLGRSYFGFLGWRGHDAALWERLVARAEAAVREPPAPVLGFDADPGAVARARASVAAAGFGDAVRVERRALDGTGGADVPGPGLVLTNPPWGERLAADADWYRRFGDALSRRHAGWRCGVFTARTAPLGRARLPLETTLEVVNGGIECRLALGDLPAARRRPDASSGASANAPAASRAVAPSSAVDATPFANRVRKNLRATKGWRRREGVRAWRAYDADLPEFAVAIDVFDCEAPGDGPGGDGGLERHVVVQEYEAPRSVNAARAADRLAALTAAVPDALDVDPSRVHAKVRAPQRSDSRPGPRDVPGEASRDDGGGARGRGPAPTRVPLVERGLRYLLEFDARLDVGLFLDHRPVRRWIGERAAGARFLNLFAYTGAASVEAAAGGAAATVSVDLSRRALEHARANLAANGLDGPRHRTVRADALEWLEAAAAADGNGDGDGDGDGDEARAGTEPEGAGAPFDLILLDPPTYSNSTSAARDWSVQNDHARAIERCMALLAKGGTLVFSNNFRRFRIDPTLSERYALEDRSAWSIDPDFRRNGRIHRCWFVRHLADAASEAVPAAPITSTAPTR